MSPDNPEDKQADKIPENIANRLIRYTKQVQDITFPIIADNDRMGAEDSSSAQNTFHFVATRWRLLRRRVVDEDKEKQAKLVWDPTVLRAEGIDYLEFLKKTLKRQIDETEANQQRWEDRKKAWQEGRDDLKSTVNNEDDLLSDIERWRQEGEETLGYLRFRLSMVETMLVQIAMLDYVLTWEEHLTGRIQPRYRELNDAERRTFIIGKALRKHVRKKGKLPDFQNRKEFTEWASELPELLDAEGEEVQSLSHATIKKALEETRCWIPGVRGQEGKGMNETLRKCLYFVELIDKNTKNN